MCAVRGDRSRKSRCTFSTLNISIVPGGLAHVMASPFMGHAALAHQGLMPHRIARTVTVLFRPGEAPLRPCTLSL